MRYIILVIILGTFGCSSAAKLHVVDFANVISGEGIKANDHLSVRLNSSEQIEGNILREDEDSITLRSQDRIVIIAKSDIRGIVKTEGTPPSLIFLGAAAGSVILFNVLGINWFLKWF